jgi:intracellular sulfur oxidation DsrE/DsrF family protein
MKTTGTLIASIWVAAVMGGDPTGAPDYKHPLIKGVGGIAVVPDAAEPPQADAKALLDITSGKKAGKVLKGLDRAALIANQHAHHGVGPKDGMKMAIVLHGPATKAALRDKAYIARSSSYAKQSGGVKGNPNLKLLERLDELGVDIYVCAQAMAHRGIGTDEIAAPVRVAGSAATVNINKQMVGYAYLPFH